MVDPKKPDTDPKEPDVDPIQTFTARYTEAGQYPAVPGLQDLHKPGMTQTQYYVLPKVFVAGHTP